MSVVIPDKLKDLPINRVLPKINLNNDFILVAATGTGKTMLIPALIAGNNGRLVILRQPTRKIAELTFKALQTFWGDQLTIGIMTSEIKELDMRLINSYNMIVVTDGELSILLKVLDKSRLTVVVDEVHWQQPATEVEISLGENYKRLNPLMQVVFLSATIDPYLFVNYFEKTSNNPIPDTIIRGICERSRTEEVNSIEQKQVLKVYYSEGVAFPVKKSVIQVEKINDIEDELMGFCYRMKTMNEAGLVFMGTRAEILSASIRYNSILPTMFVNADTPVDEMLAFLKMNPSCVVFATIALSTSITLPFYATLIIDSTSDSEYIEALEQKVNKHGIPTDSNEILQKAGRVGRTREGEAILVTERDISWDLIKPSNIIPPLRKVLPISATLISASHGVDISKANLLSNLSPSQISKSLTKLKAMNFLEQDGTISEMGAKAVSLPLDPDDAKLLMSMPPNYLAATAAFLSFTPGMFYLYEGNNKKMEEFVVNSIPVTKIMILQEAIRNKKDLKDWCKQYSLSYKQVGLALWSFGQIGKRFDKEEADFKEELLGFDIADDKNLMNGYRALICALMPKFYVHMDNTGFTCEYEGKKHYAFLSDIEMFETYELPHPTKVGGRFTLFLTKTKKVMGRVIDATVSPIQDAKQSNGFGTGNRNLSLSI